MKVLIAVVSCHKTAGRRAAIRATWMPFVPSYIDCRFFLGRLEMGTPNLQSDEVQLDVDDTYAGLPEKVSAISKYALEHGYSHVFKCDDDVYVQPQRLIESDFAQLGDYVGRKRGPSGNFPAPYASGFSYWLSRRAMELVAKMDFKSDIAEDRCVGNTLLKAGIQCVADYRYVVIDSRRNAVSHTEGPRKGNTVISACEFTPEAMRRMHDDWLKLKTGQESELPLDGRFSRICVMVKTFMRDGFLLKTVEGIQTTMPSAKVVVVDDGRESHFKISWYANLRKKGHIAAWLPFDSGFGAKANEALKYCDREFVLIASDDFNFEDPTVAEGIAKMQDVLDCDKTIDCASGRVNGRPYEALLRIEDSTRECFEKAGHNGAKMTPGGSKYYPTDLTVNFSLVRVSVFQNVKWDPDVKIGGGEHGAFYIDLKRAGYGVAYVEGANINELRGTTDWSSVDYAKYRGRARQPGRICLKRRGIDKYHLMGGSYELT